MQLGNKMGSIVVGTKSYVNLSRLILEIIKE